MAILSVTVLVGLSLLLWVAARQTLTEAWPKIVSALTARVPLAAKPPVGVRRRVSLVSPGAARRTNLPSRIAA